MNKTFVFSLLMICQTICCLALAIIAPFFPTYAESKNINEVEIGIIFSANPCGAIIGSIILGKILDESNRFKFMIFALILQGFGLYLFAVTYFEDSDKLIIATALAARLINGFATSMFFTPLYAYIPVLYPESVEEKVAVAEIFNALGYLLGPVVGSILYSFGGYLAPFLVFGTLALVLVPIIGLQISKLMKKDTVDTDQLEQLTGDLDVDHIVVEGGGGLRKNPEISPIADEMIDPDKSPLDYLQVLKIYPVLMTTMSGLAVNYMFNYFSPIIAEFLHRVYGTTSETVGYYVCVLPATYTVASIFFGKIKTYKTIIKWILAGLTVVGIGGIFMGPTKEVTYLDHSLVITLCAYGLMGIAASPVVIYIVPVINDYLIKAYPRQPTQCANMASALFNISVFSGELFGPTVAGILADKYSFEAACMGLSIFMLSIAILYIPVVFLKTSERSSLLKSFSDKKCSVLI